MDRRQLVVRGLVGPRRLARALTGGRGPIWLLTVAMLAGALVLWLRVLHLPAPASSPITLPWYVLAVAMLVAEVAVVNYDFRRESHSFSMSELPLVFGLFFLSAQDLLLATVIGTGTALLMHRRQSGLKLLFNLGHFALGAVLAVVLFHAVAGPAAGFTPRSWVAVMLAAVVTSILSTLAIFLAISLSERRLEMGKLPEQLGLALLTTLGSASLGLMGVGVAWQHPAAAWLLVVPVGSFFLAYRGYVHKRQERNSLEFLYRSARMIDEAPDLATAMSLVLRAACTTLRAEMAQLALLSHHEGELALLVTATAETAHATEWERVDAIDGLLHRALQSPQAQILALDPPLAVPGGSALRQVMIAPVRSDDHRLGALLVGNRLASAATFKASDLRLLETLVAQVTASLENGRLARTLTEAIHRADRERHNALVLQRGILPPPLPRLENVSVAVRYVPGSVGMEVGGDWYDVIALPSGDIGVAIGDVVGHDLEAAARMGQARSALRAYATEGHRPGAVMERLNRLLVQTDADFLGTCCYLQFSPAHDLVTFVSAGHPPPLLIRPDGSAWPVQVDPNLPLGVDQTETYAEVMAPMPPGAALVLYTDGLVESRSLPLDVGLARLGQVPPRTARGNLESLADHLLLQATRGGVDDDVTLLLLRHEGRAADARRPVSQRYALRH